MRNLNIFFISIFYLTIFNYIKQINLDVELEEVWKDIDKVKIDKNNINIFADILVELEKRKKYNFKNYIISNYNKNKYNKFN